MSERLLINARWVVPVEPAGAVLERHAVAVRDGRIEAIAPAGEAVQRFADYARVDLPGHALMPGLVNLHTHAAMALMRGLADDLPLMRWLQEHIWPAESRHVSAGVRARRHPARLRRDAARRRHLLQRHVLLPGGGARGGARRRACARRSALIVDRVPVGVRRRRRGLPRQGPRAARPLARRAAGVVLPRAARALHRVRRDVPADGARWPTNSSCRSTCTCTRPPTRSARSVAEHGVRPLERLARARAARPGADRGARGAPDARRNRAARRAHGCSVAHCPSSNLKLASGIAPVARAARGGRQRRARHRRRGEQQPPRPARGDAARRPARQGRRGDAEAMPAHAGAARCDAGWRPRARASTRASARSCPASRPTSSPWRSTTSSCSPATTRFRTWSTPAAGEHVSDVWVAGERVVRDRELVRIDLADLQARTALWHNKILN